MQQMHNGNAIPNAGRPDDQLTPYDKSLSNTESRESLTRQVVNHSVDLFETSLAEGKEFYEKLDEMSPAHAVELRDGESHSAIGSVAEHMGIVLRDNPRSDVYSTPLGDIRDNPAKLMVLKSCSKLNLVNRIRKPFSMPTFQEHQLAFGIGDFAVGSAFNPYNAMPLVDGTKLSVFPPISAVIADVMMVPIGGTFLVPEYKSPPTNAQDEEPEEWQPGTPIPLGRVNAVQTQLTPKWWAGGFTLDNEFRNSAYGANLVMMRSDKESIRLARQIVKDALTQAQSSTPSLDNISVNLSASTLTHDQIIGIAMAFNNEQEDYTITTLLGNTATVRKYLGIDRSGLYNNSNSPTTGGSVVGGDMYGRAGVNRMVYDTSAITIANNNLLGIDASETVDLHIQTGSEEETETYIERTRAFEFAYTIKYLAHLRAPDSGNPRKLFT